MKDLGLHYGKNSLQASRDVQSGLEQQAPTKARHEPSGFAFAAP